MFTRRKVMLFGLIKKSVSVRSEKVTETFVDPRSKKDVQAAREADFTIEPGKGFLDGRVVTNVYLGHSVESYVDTPEGEILVQVDNPMARRIFAEGEAVSVSFVPEYTKVFPEEATAR